MKNNRSLSIVLAVILAFSAMLVAAFTASATEADGTDAKVVVTGVRNLQSNCEIYENGEKITELKLVNGFEGSTYDIVARVLNPTFSEFLVNWLTSINV